MAEENEFNQKQLIFIQKLPQKFLIDPSQLINC